VGLSEGLGGWEHYLESAEDPSQEAPHAAQAEEEAVLESGQWRHLWVFAEIRGDHVRASTYELMGRSRELADALGARVGAVILGPQGTGKKYQDNLVRAGADTVYVMESSLFDRQDPDLTVDALETLARKRRPELILFGQSTFNDSVAGRLAVRLGTGAVARVKDLRLDTADRLFLFRQEMFESRVSREAAVPKERPQIATVLRRSYQRPLPDTMRTGRVVEELAEVGPDAVRLSPREQKQQAEPVPLEHADVVVFCGKGIASAEGYERAKALTKILKGAQMAASKSAVDLAYAPADHLVGLHGRRIRPKLLITLGISGDLDTLEGIDRSRLTTWIAVDRDPEANVLDEAHVAVVSEWEPFVDQLIETLEAEKRALAFD
jgi:electron transfer flavoprotein alpha subunit